MRNYLVRKYIRGTCIILWLQCHFSECMLSYEWTLLSKMSVYNGLHCGVELLIFSAFWACVFTEKLAKQVILGSTNTYCHEVPKLMCWKFSLLFIGLQVWSFAGKYFQKMSYLLTAYFSWLFLDARRCWNCLYCKVVIDVMSLSISCTVWLSCWIGCWINLHIPVDFHMTRKCSSTYRRCGMKIYALLLVSMFTLSV